LPDLIAASKGLRFFAIAAWPGTGGDTMEISIRHERPDEYDTVEELVRETFWNLYVPGCDEHYLVYRMRTHADYLPQLSFIAVMDNKIIGAIFYTRSYLESEEKGRIETMSFGPLCVHPDYQRKGIGTQLINHTKALVAERKVPAILILGDPHNYCLHGFRNGIDLKVSSYDGTYPLGLLVLELKKGFLGSEKYRLKLSDVFEMNQDEVTEYDKKFRKKKKAFHHSQELFSMLVRARLDDNR
jgi:predicted N-acetyltransferase YhbS